MQVYDLSTSQAAAAIPFKGLRARAQHEAAYSLGTQAGVAWRYSQIDHMLWSEAPELDELFNFRPLMLNDGKVFPPVVTMGEHPFDLQNPRAARSSLVIWHIVVPAKIVTVVPSWNDYLIAKYTVNLKSVNAALLPNNHTERVLWHNSILQGWQAGISQANHLYRVALAKLTRDYLGISRYHLLAREGMLSVPDLAVGNLGIVVNRSTMTVGTKVYRIEEDAKWKKSVNWKAHSGS